MRFVGIAVDRDAVKGAVDILHLFGRQHDVGCLEVFIQEGLPVHSRNRHQSAVLVHQPCQSDLCIGGAFLLGISFQHLEDRLVFLQVLIGEPCDRSLGVVVFIDLSGLDRSGEETNGQRHVRCEAYSQLITGLQHTVLLRCPYHHGVFILDDCQRADCICFTDLRFGRS